MVSIYSTIHYDQAITRTLCDARANSVFNSGTPITLSIQRYASTSVWIHRMDPSSTRNGSLFEARGQSDSTGSHTEYKIADSPHYPVLVLGFWDKTPGRRRHIISP